eukprot:4773177-Amphidinium_carterae.2
MDGAHDVECAMAGTPHAKHGNNRPDNQTARIGNISPPESDARRVVTGKMCLQHAICHLHSSCFVWSWLGFDDVALSTSETNH